ncbi:MAG: hypothetical protein ORN85_08400, partial [Sediminibacterium sp.]|nr:hypothetical protein [Sediminibacterium sp.]
DSVGLTIWGATSNGIAVIPDSVRKIVYIASGNGVTFALKADATVFGWGYSLLNQTAIPPDLKDVVDIRGGSAHVIALKSDGRMVSWGTENNYPNINPYNGRSIGNNFVISQTPQDSGYIAITTGFYYSCALKFNFQLTCWGGDEISYFTVPLAPKKIARFSGGDGQLLLLFNDGTVKNLNDGSYSNLTPPKNFTNIIRVSAGGDFNTVLDKFGKVSAWGNNDVGQTNIPAFLDSIIDIANSSQHSSALRFNGDVFAWGSNNAGQINIPSGLNNVITINSNSSTARTLAIHYIIVSTKIDSGGSILPKTFARNNDAVRVTYKIDSNYRIDSIFINGIYNPAASKDSLSGYTFYKLIGLANIYVKLKRLYKINTLVKNGSISPSIWIDSNSNFKVTFLPNSNLVIDSVVINDDYQRFNYDSLLLSISGRNVTKNISIIIIFNPPLPPFSSGYPNAAQSFVQCDSNVNKANFTISANCKNLKVQNKDFIKLTRFQWYRNNRNDTTNLVLMEGDSGRLFTLDTVLSVQPTRNIVDTGFYFIKVFNSYGLYAYSDPIGPIITHPLPTSKVYINNNNGLQCIALGDSNRVAYHIYNPNGEIITHQIFETNSEGNNQTKVNTIQVNDTFFTNYFRLL